MKLIYPAIALMLITASACKKSNSKQLVFGVWVEKSLRLDTLDFDIQNLIDATEPTVNFLSKPYTDTVLNPVFPVSHASLYNYLLNDNKTNIQLRSHFRSSTGYDSYSILFSTNGTAFTIGKFYNRRSLPAVIEFEKIR